MMVKWDKLVILDDSNIEIHLKGKVYIGHNYHYNPYFDFDNHLETCGLLFGSKSCVRDDIKSKFNVRDGYWPESDNPLDFAIRYFKANHTIGGKIIDYRILKAEI